MRRGAAACRGVVFALAVAAGWISGAMAPGGLRSAQAQSATAGAITGVVVDLGSGEPLPGIIIEVTSRSLLGKRAAFTDERGAYKITELPPGAYTVRFHYDRLTVKRTGIVVGVQKATPVFQAIDTGAIGAGGTTDGGEVIELEHGTFDPEARDRAAKLGHRGHSQ